MKVRKWPFILVAFIMLLGVINLIKQVAERFSYQNLLIITIVLCGWVVVMGVIIHLAGRE